MEVPRERQCSADGQRVPAKIS